MLPTLPCNIDGYNSTRAAKVKFPCVCMDAQINVLDPLSLLDHVELGHDEYGIVVCETSIISLSFPQLFLVISSTVSTTGSSAVVVSAVGSETKNVFSGAVNLLISIFSTLSFRFLQQTLDW